MSRFGQEIRSSLENGGPTVHYGERKHDQVPDLLADPVAAVFFLKEPVEPLAADVCLDVARIKALARPLQGVGVEIGCKDLKVRRCLAVFCGLLEQDREGIGFFAGGAADGPDTNDVVSPLTTKEARISSLASLSKTSGSRKKCVTVISRSSPSARTSSLWSRRYSSLASCASSETPVPPAGP
jgi:hypothetical protein